MNFLMDNYFGCKRIQAMPMTRGKYNEYRGWVVPADENPDDEGYLVEYMDSGKSNHPKHTGYISWSPKDVFEKAYRRTSGLTFGLAIEALKTGALLAREGWNGKNMWIEYVGETEYEILSGTVAASLPLRPFIVMKTADDQTVPWVASQTDILAEDWGVL